MTGLNYPDNLYADHEERKARARQAPVGAYRAPTEMPESERKLRTALAYVNHARDLIREALGDNASALHDVNRAAMNQPERVPKWDLAWGKAPNCDGLKARDIRAPHPMAAETLREFERDDNAQRDWPTPQRLEIERVPKLDPRWGVPLREQKGYSVGTVTSDSPAVYQNRPPNCDGLVARDIRGPHPMQAEVIRDRDERPLNEADKWWRDDNASGV